MARGQNPRFQEPPVALLRARDELTGDNPRPKVEGTNQLDLFSEIPIARCKGSIFDQPSTALASLASERREAPLTGRLFSLVRMRKGSDTEFFPRRARRNGRGGERSKSVRFNTSVPLLLDCHCEESRVRDDEAIHLDRHGALPPSPRLRRTRRAPRDDTVQKLRAIGIKWDFPRPPDSARIVV